MCQFQKRLDTYDRPIGLTDAIRIMGCSAPRASQVPGESQLSVCTCSVDSGRTAGTRPIKCRSMAPGVGKTEAPAIGLSKLNSMAFRLAVYASPDGLPAYDARLASGRWSSSTGRAFHPQDSYERFQICILHFIRLSHACLAQSDTPKRHRFDSPCWQFLIQWRSQSEYRWTSVERECDCDVDVAYRFVHGKVTGVCPTHSISFKTNIDRPVW